MLDSDTRTESTGCGTIVQPPQVLTDDRQCAWELLVQMSTRVAVTGKSSGDDDFAGEILVESLDSLYAFFREARSLLCRLPVGLLKPGEISGAIVVTACLFDTIRPFLEQWQSDYRHWWAYEGDKAVPPRERQLAYPGHSQFVAEWAVVRRRMRRLQQVLVRLYQFPDLAAVPAQWNLLAAAQG